jgi:hypothetical protein
MSLFSVILVPKVLLGSKCWHSQHMHVLQHTHTHTGEAHTAHTHTHLHVHICTSFLYTCIYII